MHTKDTVPYFPAGDVFISWPDPGSLARRVISRSNTKVTLKYPSFKCNEKSKHAESPYERDFYIRLDVETDVIEYFPQPAKIFYLDAGIMHVHFPDTLVTRSERRRSFVEIKSSNDPKLLEAKRRGELLKPGLLKQGFDYEVITSDEIHMEPFFSNARTLLRLGRKSVSTVDAEAMRIRLRDRQGTTWRDILMGELGESAPFHTARMILDGSLNFDGSKPLGSATVITPISTSHKE